MTENQHNANSWADFIRGTGALHDVDPRQLAYFSKVIIALRVRHEFKDKWSWGAAAEYLYRALIKALGIGEDDEDELIRLAKPKPGRKEERQLATRIYSLKAKGKTVSQIKKILEKENQNYTREAIESYLKTRRKQRKTLAS